jgi:ribose transport system substrate-binding protein
MGNAFYVSMECGIRAEAAKYGFKINIQGPQQFDPSLQTPIVNAVVAAKPAGLFGIHCRSARTEPLRRRR